MSWNKHVEIGFVVYHDTLGTAMILSGSVFPISVARAAPVACKAVGRLSGMARKVAGFSRGEKMFLKGGGVLGHTNAEPF